MTRIIRMELARLLYWKRWILAGLMITTAGIVTALELANDTQSSGMAINQWDVPLVALNNPITLLFLLVPALVGLVGDVVLRDRWTGFALLSLPRIGSRTRWWLGKLGATLIASVVFFVGTALLLAVVALPFTGAAWRLSAYSSAPQLTLRAAQVTRLYSPPPFPELPVLGVLLVALYTALATFALVALILAVAQMWPRPWAPLLLTFGVVIVFYGMEATNALHPLIHLIWDYHNFSDRVFAVEWWASAMVIGVQTVAAMVFGAYMLRQRDI